jgi:hypothetical protein
MHTTQDHLTTVYLCLAKHCIIVILMHVINSVRLTN